MPACPGGIGRALLSCATGRRGGQLWLAVLLVLPYDVGMQRHAPASESSAKTRVVRVRMEPDLVAAVENLAAQADRTLSSEVRRALKAWLAAERDGAPPARTGRVKIPRL